MISMMIFAVLYGYIYDCPFYVYASLFKIAFTGIFHFLIGEGADREGRTSFAA